MLKGLIFLVALGMAIGPRTLNEPQTILLDGNGVKLATLFAGLDTMEVKYPLLRESARRCGQRGTLTLLDKLMGTKVAQAFFPCYPSSCVGYGYREIKVSCVGDCNPEPYDNEWIDSKYDPSDETYNYGWKNGVTHGCIAGGESCPCNRPACML